MPLLAAESKMKVKAEPVAYKPIRKKFTEEQILEPQTEYESTNNRER